MTSIQDNEKIQNTSNHICLLTIERDTYRDLCAELLAELREARLFFDYDFLHDLYQEKSLMGGINRVAAAITKAEAILGEKK